MSHAVGKPLGRTNAIPGPSRYIAGWWQKSSGAQAPSGAVCALQSSGMGEPTESALDILLSHPEAWSLDNIDWDGVAVKALPLTSASRGGAAAQRPSRLRLRLPPKGGNVVCQLSGCRGSGDRPLNARSRCACTLHPKRATQ